MIGNLIQKALESSAEENVMSKPTSRRALLTGGVASALGVMAASATAQQQGRPQQMGRPQVFGGGKPKPSSGGTSSVGAPASNGGFADPGTRPMGAPLGAKSGSSRYWLDTNKKLLRRISYGATATDLAHINAIGFQAYLDEQLNYSAIDDSAVETIVNARCPYLGFDVPSSMTLSDQWRCARSAAEANIYRAVYSNRQLYQRMVEFWSDHFFVDDMKCRGGQTMVFMRDVIWPNALGNFRNLLVGSMNSSAMIFYLDNQTSSAGKLNVNLARELLELHTVGVNGGYTEDDIYEVARIITGWSIEKDPANITEYFNFKYESSYHEPGDKTVMGQTFTSGGKSEGDALIDWLAYHPKTGAYIGSKLVQFFLGYEPTTHMKDQLGQLWATSNGDIVTMLRAILTEELVANSVPKFKRPYHLIVGAVRQMPHYEFSKCEGVIYHMQRNEHMAFKWNAPDGFPDRFDYWAPGMVHRLNYSMQFANNKVWQARWNPSDLLAGAPRDEKNVLDVINATFFSGELPYNEQLWLRRYLRNKSLTDNEIRGAIAIALGSPAYQWF